MLLSVKFLSTNASEIIAATKAAKVPRLLVIGGAGSREVGPGLTLVNTPNFPAEYKPETLAGVEFLDVLRGEKELDWMFLFLSYFVLPANAPANSGSVKTNFWLLLTVKAHIQRRLCDRSRGFVGTAEALSATIHGWVLIADLCTN